MRTILLLSTLALAAIALSGPAGSSANATAPTTANAADARAAVTVRDSRFGRILFDGKGYVLYAFTRDPRSRSACSGACAAAWPPFLVSDRAAAGKGTRRTLIGTTRRADGKLQVTYAGRPLYYYVGDREPGQILCQDIDEFGGTWLVARANGTLVR